MHPPDQTGGLPFRLSILLLNHRSVKFDAERAEDKDEKNKGSLKVKIWVTT